MADESDYTSVKPLGGGGQGSCLLVRRSKDQQLFVYKTLKYPELFRGKAREASIMEMLLECNRITKYFQSYKWPEHSQIIYEFCDAGDLGKIIEKYAYEDRIIPEAFVWHVFIQLAEALAFIHYGYGASSEKRKNWTRIIHRDLKPENVFLKWRPGSTRYDSYPDVKLGDFGLAGVPSDPDHKDSTYLGSYMWQGPEIPLLTAKGDIWSLGAIIHAMAYEGDPPIDQLPKAWKNTKENRALWSKNPTARAPKPIDAIYSTQLSKWVDTTLELDPSDRITSLQLAEELYPVAKKNKHKLFTALKRWSMPIREE